MLKKHTEQMKENGYWLNILNQYYWYKADMDSNFQQVVESITPKMSSSLPKPCWNKTIALKSA